MASPYEASIRRVSDLMYFERRYKGLIERLSDYLTADMRKEILCAQVSSARSIDIGEAGNEAFFEKLREIGKFTPKNLDASVFGDYAMLKELVNNNK